jgi:predicted component of type VI protein secretion system
MAEAQVNRVPLIMEFRFVSFRLIDEFGQPIHFFFARGDEPGRTFRFIDHPRFGFSPNEIDYLRQDRRSGIEQLGMGLGAARVPIAIGFPTIFSWAENVAFTR